jgi:response regulator RpfG family c-di-GMP phosphodiesterase
MTHRAYRDPVPPAEALAELQRRAGRDFDPGLIKLFASLVG